MGKSKLQIPKVCKYCGNTFLAKTVKTGYCSHQWAMRRENDGHQVEIGQDTVVYLDTLIKSLKTYTGKFQKSRDGHFTITDCWMLERAIAYYGEHDRDGKRHTALFVIKNRLADDDCELFVDWLRQNHPSKMHHWLSHKRLVRTSE